MKLMIADDDEQIRRGITNGVDWKSMGIKEVLPASDGVEALKLFSEKFPEIVITDIRMPEIDGLELFRRIKEIKPSTKVIIISGYSDFEYLKKAIQLNAVDYELKPISVRSLINLIKKAQDDIARERVSEEKFEKYLESHKKDFVLALFKGNVTDRNIILEELKQYFDFDARGILMCIALEIDNYFLLKKDKEDEITRKTEEILKDGVREIQLDSTKGLLLCIGENEFVIIIKTVDSALFMNNLRVEMKGVINDLNCCLNAEIGISVSAGISNSGNIAQLYNLYNEARGALKYKLYTGSKSVNYYKKSLSDESNFTVLQIKEQELKELIHNLNIDSIKIMICDEFERLKKEQCCSRDSIMNFSINLVNLIINTIGEHSSSLKELISSRAGHVKEIEFLETVDHYRDYVINAYDVLIKEYANVKFSKCSPVMLKASEYIRKNYNKELTAEFMAEYIGITPNYFSHLFKKEFGVTFSEYVNKIRVAKAKELILNSDFKIYEIVDKVGYRNYVYFIQMFKKLEGCSPTDLRKGDF